MKKSVIVVFVVVVLIAVGGYLMFVRGSGIDSEKEVVKFAKQDEGVRNFIDGVDGNVVYSAYFDDDSDVWRVLAYSKEDVSASYKISFTKGGQIVSSG
jgi:hypothetical protein